MARVWLRGSLHIPVDHLGYCETFAEGALGCVVEVRDSTTPGLRQAFKLPRLLADTTRENAYIEDLMQKEVDSLRLIAGDQHAASRGLLSFDLGGLGFLKGLTQTAEGIE